MTRTIWHYSPEEVEVWGQVYMAYVVPFADPKPVLLAYRQSDDRWPTLWCEVDPPPRVATTIYAIIGTGHPIPVHPQRREHGVHVASCVDPTFPLVWHVYRLDP